MALEKVMKKQLSKHKLKDITAIVFFWLFVIAMACLVYLKIKILNP